MVELVCSSLTDHVTRIHREVRAQAALYDLPARQWHVPDPGGPDLTVRFHGDVAANPAGPAAGPHGQMAQNIVLSYLAGGRIVELKTVQVNDRLSIPRPCIDATNVGYNVEWSQELRLHESLHEYVCGAMLVHMIRQGGFFEGVDMAGPLGSVIYDMSVGYDLAGIMSPSVRRFIESMLDARRLIDALRLQIPREHAHLRDLDYPTRISSSVTLSTFHECPADEIERICEHLIDEYGVGVIVKMNPPMLGAEALEHLLHDVMGYQEIRVYPPAYDRALPLDRAVDMIRRLDAHARRRGVRCGAKFSNTLEVVNHRDFFGRECEVMYMSGAPLYVITMALTSAFRQAIGPDFPVSFSAGVDQKNFADVVACGIVPVTMCTDLLRPGGFARMPKYLSRLTAEMTRLGTRTIDEYVLARCGDRSITDPAAAGVHNTIHAAGAAAREEERYRKTRNQAEPRRIGSHLVIFDCVTCDKCVPVCPNDANFTYPLAERAFEYSDFRVDAGGHVAPVGPAKRFTTTESRQIANFSDYCNECGNCDTFCPEYGGPFIEKPTFFGRREEFELRGDRDGFWVSRRGPVATIHGRMAGATYLLRVDHAGGRRQFNDGQVEIVLDDSDRPISARPLVAGAPSHAVEMRVYHTLRLLLEGVLDPTHVNPVNARCAED